VAKLYVLATAAEVGNTRPAIAAIAREAARPSSASNDASKHSNCDSKTCAGRPASAAEGRKNDD
jgi:hypothetical protein